MIVPDESTAPAKLTETAVAPIVESTPEKLNVLDDSETGPEVSRPKADPLEDDATVPAKLTESPLTAIGPVEAETQMPTDVLAAVTLTTVADMVRLVADVFPARTIPAEQDPAELE